MSPDTILPSDALDRPTGEATGLPGSYYAPEAYERERAPVFARRWIPIGVGATIPNPGDVQPVDIAGYPLLLVRNADGAIKCFANVCRHRGMRLVNAACRQRTSLQCPWHAWNFDLDGTLIGTPKLAGDREGQHPAFERAGLGLKELPIGRWLDLVFVNIDGKAGAFDDFIRPLREKFSGYDLGGAQFADQVTTEFHGNWKLVVEGAMENYHLPFLHPQIAADKTVDWRHEAIGECGIAMSYNLADTPGAAYNAVRHAPLPWCPTMPKGEEARFYLIHLFPSALVALSRVQLLLSTLIPDRADHTTYTRHIYFFGDAATSPDFELHRQEMYRSWAEVGDQDKDIVRAVQRNAEARDVFGIDTRFSPYWEPSVHNFQKLVRRALGAA